MKKIHIALLASLACLFTVSCEKEEDDTPLYTTNSFKVEAPEFVDENGSKVYLRYTDEASSLIYEEGDQVYINGKLFTLVRDGGWRAISNDGEPITGKRFLVTYVDGEVSHFDSAASTYQFNLNTTLTSSANNKIILGGVAENAGDYVIKLKPACAILRINTKGAGSHYSDVKVGFDANKVPKTGTINVSNRTLDAGGTSNYLAGVAQGGYGDFLYMRYSDPLTTGENDYWYVAIPIEGNSVTTTLYLEWNDGTTTVQHKTQAPVTLRKGYVYTLGTERQTPFNVNACGLYFFYVDGSNHRVSFTSGNLQCQKYTNESTFDEEIKWRFAPHQYSSIGNDNDVNMTNEGAWFDLFGYGTSNWSGSGAVAFEPYSISTTNADYYATDLASTNADWGVYNRMTPGIYYGNSLVRFNKLRTLTDAEWTFLIGRSGKSGLVCINNTYNGLMLLPNTGKNGTGTWTNTTDVDLSSLSNSSITNITMAQWDALEAIGAIFLPCAGSRNGVTTSLSNRSGNYWSATTHNASRGKALSVSTITNTVTSSNTTKYTGCSVRLVANVGSW